jgi:transposase InsO family protein
MSTSGFYHWLSRPQSATAARRQVLTARVQVFFSASDGVYGYRRIHADLVDEASECSPELVRHIMRDEGLVACQQRPFWVTNQPDGESATSTPDLVKRDWTAIRPGVKFVGDITNLRTWQGFVYLATVIEAGAVFHSDRGSVHNSVHYRTLVTRLGMRSSMGKTGACWDNTLAESFFSALKNERVHRTVYATKAQATRNLTMYIEGWD